jgi:pyruvate/2-oxoglutarate dehydrogenase complex dihydrolipoamide acyltransferase (E2) component
MLNKMCQAKTTETQPTTQAPKVQTPKAQAPKAQAPKVQAPKSNTQLIDLNKQIQQSLGNQQPTGQITNTEIDAILTKLG